MKTNIILLIITLSVTMSFFAHSQTLEWGFAIGSSGDSDYVTGIDSDALNNVYIIGTFYESMDFDPSEEQTILTTSEDGGFLSKYDINGELVWTINCGSNPVDIKVINNYIYVLEYDAYSTYLNKYNSAGILQFSRLLTDNGAPRCMAIDNGNNLYIVGNFNIDANLEEGNPEAQLLGTGVYVSKYNTNDEFVSAFVISGNNPNYGQYYNIWVRDIHIDIYNNIIIGGQFGATGPEAETMTFDFDPGVNDTQTTFEDYADMFFAKYSQTGELLWYFTEGKDALTPDVCTSITSDDAGNLYFAGVFSGQIDFDISETSEFILQHPNPQSYLDMGFVAKFSNTGSIIDARALLVNYAIININYSNNDIYLSFTSNTTDTDFDLGENDYFIDEIGSERNAAFVAKYTDELEFVWTNFVFGYNPTAKATKILENGDIFLTGNYNVSLFLDSNNLTDSIINNGYYNNTYSSDIFLAKFIQSPVLQSEFTDTLVCINTDYSLQVEVSGSSPLNFQWYKNGTAIDGYNTSELSLNNINLSDEGDYYCVVSNDYGTVQTNTFSISVVDLEAEIIGNLISCMGNQLFFDSEVTTNYPNESEPYLYEWSSNGNVLSQNEEFDFTPDNSFNLILRVQDGNNCVAYDSADIEITTPYDNLEIFLVTVDPIGKNNITWEIPSNEIDKIESFIIYKEDSYDEYIQIGNVANSESSFIDIFSDPASHGDKYKISLLDTCGNESEISPYHKTMNLTISAFESTMGLNWDAYVDESGTYTPTRYYIFKGTNAENMELFDSISGSFTSYNDNNVSNLSYYKIGIFRTNGTKSIPEMSFSNIINNSEFIGIDEYLSSSNELEVYPNPTTNQIKLNFNCNLINDDELVLKITNINGEVIKEKTIAVNSNLVQNAIIVNTNDWSNGVYNLIIRSVKQNKTWTKKIIIIK